MCHSAEKFRGHPFNVSENLGYRKFLCIREGGGITFLRRKHLSHSTEKFRWGTIRCFRKIRVSQIFVPKMGISLNSVEKISCHSADKFRKRTLLCFGKILESKNFQQKRGKLQDFVGSFFYIWMRGGLITIFRPENFCLTVPKYFIGEQFFVSKNFSFQNFSCIWAGSITVLSKIFVSQDRNEKFCEGPLLFSRKNMVTKNFLHNSGIMFFRRKLLVSQCPKVSWASLQCFRNFAVSKNFMHNREYHNFPSKNVCFIEPKNFVKEPISVSLVSGIKKCWG